MNVIRTKHSCILAGSLALAMATSVSAQDSTASDAIPAEKQTYLSILGTYTDVDSDRNVDFGNGASLIVGRQLGHGNWFIEGQLLTNILETDVDGTDFYNYGAGADLVYSLNGRKGWSPFALVGIGGNYDDVRPDSEDEWNFFANAGLGMVSKPLGTYGLRIRAEARYVYDDFQDGYGDIRYGLGLELPLQPYERPIGVAATPAAPVNVVSVQDLADSDGDGVPDKFDKCPGTAQGMTVDGVGCAIAQVLTLTGVNFEFASARLTSDSRKILEDVAAKIKHFENVPMELAGHTDSVGSDAYNEKLSQQRAESVREFLVEQGVPGANLAAKGYGESKPVADNKTDAGRQLNRRVELHVEGQTAPVEAPAATDAATSPAEAPATDAAAPAADAAAPTEATAPATDAAAAPEAPAAPEASSTAPAADAAAPAESSAQ